MSTAMAMCWFLPSRWEGCGLSFYEGQACGSAGGHGRRRAYAIYRLAVSISVRLTAVRQSCGQPVSVRRTVPRLWRKHAVNCGHQNRPPVPLPASGRTARYASVSLRFTCLARRFSAVNLGCLFDISVIYSRLALPVVRGCNYPEVSNVHAQYSGPVGRRRPRKYPARVSRSSVARRPDPNQGRRRGSRVAYSIRFSWPAAPIRPRSLRLPSTMK